MLTRLVVFTGLLLVFAINSGDVFAAAIDNDISDSPNINIVWDRYDNDGVNLDNNIVLDAYDRDEDSRGDVDLNADGNLRNDDEQLVDGDTNQFDLYDLQSANVVDDINYELNP